MLDPEQHTRACREKNERFFQHLHAALKAGGISYTESSIATLRGILWPIVMRQNVDISALLNNALANMRQVELLSNGVASCETCQGSGSLQCPACTL